MVIIQYGQIVPHQKNTNASKVVIIKKKKKPFYTSYNLTGNHFLLYIHAVEIK